MADRLGGQYRVRCAGFQSDVTIAIAIDAKADDVDRQHLNLPDFTGPGPCCACRVKVSVLRHFHCGQQLRAKEFRPAAIMGKGNQRIHGVEVTLNGAKVGLKSPERGDHGTAAQDLGVDPGRRQGASGCRFRHATGDRFTSHSGQELSEVTSACGGIGR